MAEIMQTNSLFSPIKELTRPRINETWIIYTMLRYTIGMLSPNTNHKIAFVLNLRYTVK